MESAALKASRGDLKLLRIHLIKAIVSELSVNDLKFTTVIVYVTGPNST